MTWSSRRTPGWAARSWKNDATCRSSDGLAAKLTPVRTPRNTKMMNEVRATESTPNCQGIFKEWLSVCRRFPHFTTRRDGSTDCRSGHAHLMRSENRADTGNFTVGDG